MQVGQQDAVRLQPVQVVEVGEADPAQRPVFVRDRLDASIDEGRGVDPQHEVSARQGNVRADPVVDGDVDSELLLALAYDCCGLGLTRLDPAARELPPTGGRLGVGALLGEQKAVAHDRGADHDGLSGHGEHPTDSCADLPERVDLRKLWTCDQMVTYLWGVAEDDEVFKALADPTRRFLLDLLFTRDGRTLTELESELEMTRFGVMKHLRVLEAADLVVTRRSGREKLHFLNPVPIRLIHDRWIDKYAERRVSALADLKVQLENPTDEKPATEKPATEKPAKADRTDKEERP
ncbi:DNA-binding transcriptional regulator, ArsR family [Actinopolymorpha cephalotaxi]|uniref:DNA-binding transcriptional regulator, ArsR family n=2 Tax=Actinopolymorpha cephalotaxi TaxID=504797 RepID=A0A1I2NC59_9ACTN|nr:DNA-binding transcriptional regulator, ArsR family [Actinopolymorpha cephalotaxi]